MHVLDEIKAVEIKNIFSAGELYQILTGADNDMLKQYGRRLMKEYRWANEWTKVEQFRLNLIEHLESLGEVEKILYEL